MINENNDNSNIPPLPLSVLDEELHGIDHIIENNQQVQSPEPVDKNPLQTSLRFNLVKIPV